MNVRLQHIATSMTPGRQSGASPQPHRRCRRRLFGISASLWPRWPLCRARRSRLSGLASLPPLTALASPTAHASLTAIASFTALASITALASHRSRICQRSPISPRALARSVILRSHTTRISQPISHLSPLLLIRQLRHLQTLWRLRPTPSPPSPSPTWPPPPSPPPHVASATVQPLFGPAMHR